MASACVWSMKKRVQERLDARRGGGAVEEVCSQLVHHRLVAHRVESTQREQRLEAYRGMARRVDRREVSPRALHVKDVHFAMDL